MPAQPTPAHDEVLRGCYNGTRNFARREKALLACTRVLERDSKRAGEMNHQNIVAKLNQIVEQAQLTLQDPKSLTMERQRMIIALARYVSTEVSIPTAARPES